MKRKPIARFYFPGLISLVFLPLMCVAFFAYKGRLERLAMMEVFWTNDNFYKAGYVYKSKAFDPYTYRKLENIPVTSAQMDTALFNSLEAKIGKLITTKDTVHGFCVVFSDKTTYGNLVGVLDICKRFEETGLLFYPYKDRMFIFNKISKKYEGALFECTVIPFPPPKPTMLDMMSASLLHSKEDFLRSGNGLISFWPSLISFVLMIFFSVRRKMVIN